MASASVLTMHNLVDDMCATDEYSDLVNRVEQACGEASLGCRLSLGLSVLLCVLRDMENGDQRTQIIDLVGERLTIGSYRLSGPLHIDATKQFKNFTGFAPSS